MANFKFISLKLIKSEKKSQIFFLCVMFLFRVSLCTDERSGVASTVISILQTDAGHLWVLRLIIPPKDSVLEGKFPVISGKSW